MPFQKGNTLGGRKAGTPNKVSASAKQSFIDAAAQLGGVERMVAWAKEDPANERVFWGLYARLIPVEVAGDPDAPVVMTITREIIGARAKS